MQKQVIIFHYELKGGRGEIIDSSFEGEPLAFLEGSGQIIAGLEDAILKMNPGDKDNIVVEYQDAYGPYDQTLVFQIPKDQFPQEGVKPGDVFQIEKGGTVRMITVVEVSDDNVTVDANHPMAGKNLSFVIEIVERRDATPEEIAHGHAHGKGGGHHH